MISLRALLLYCALCYLTGVGVGYFYGSARARRMGAQLWAAHLEEIERKLDKRIREIQEYKVKEEAPSAERGNLR